MGNTYPSEIENNLNERHLDLKRVLALNEPQQKIVIKMFDDLLNCFGGDRGISMPGGYRIDYLSAQVLYTTLTEAEFLVTRREKNLNEVLDSAVK